MPTIEDINYLNDRRVRAGQRDKPSYDESARTIEVLLEDDEGCESAVHFPARMEVCGTCDGHGRHANPSIDCGGLTARDFDEDPGFREAYFDGAYDVDCYECGGKRVVPVIDHQALEHDEELTAAYERWLEVQRDNAACEATMRAERMMGA